MALVGYADRLRAAPRDRVEFKVSSSLQQFHARLVRLWHGDDHPDGAGVRLRHVPSTFEQTYDGELQPLDLGSYGRISAFPAESFGGSWTVHVWAWPTTPQLRDQTLLAYGDADADGWALRLREGQVVLYVAGRAVAASPVSLHARCWYSIAAAVDAENGTARLEIETNTGLDLAVHSATSACAPGTPPEADLTFAAEPASGRARARRFYNGKLEAPTVWSTALSRDEMASVRLADSSGLPTPVAAWDFADGISGQKVTDVSGNGRRGRLVNRPTRAMTGHRWAGTESAWKHAPTEYGAIHFHDDDLDDANWSTTFGWDVPDDLPSGVYAAHLTGEGKEDFIPVFVRPRPGTASAAVALVIPTFSYLAYANEQMSNQNRGLDEGQYPLTDHDRFVVANRLLSLYDLHSDGSGVCYSSRLRPIVNMRPTARLASLNGGNGGPHQLSADLHLVDWLNTNGYEVDILTDEDVHLEGHSVLAPYRVVLSGTHSEYWSGQMLDAARSYLMQGGRWMQLSGNNAYWVTQLDPETGATIEVRRRGPAQRTWDAQPGEAHMSISGERGGLWRHRGRSPHTWLGAGTAAETLAQGRPYVRQPASRTPEGAWVFDGVSGDEFGGIPCLVNVYGAGGFEIDRFDPALGSPPQTLLLASATDFNSAANPGSEDILFTQADSELRHLVRADMVLLPYPRGGATFTPGSISWCASLSYNDYDNDISRVTRNVLDGFLGESVMWL